MRPLCIYHANCADGFAGAWVVRRKYKNAEFFKGFHQTFPPDVTGRDVILVDFSYNLKTMLDICSKAKSVLMLDHHESAARELEGLNRIAKCPTELVFDMRRAGSMIAWDYFFPTEKCPVLLEHIQDQDLWKFKLKKTREIQLCLFSYPYDFEVWDALMTYDLDRMYYTGVHILRKQSKDIKEFLTLARHNVIIDGVVVPAVNAPYTIGTDAAYFLALDAPFAAYYYILGKIVVFGLRSAAPFGLDVQKIAVKYGGGGHKRAAGFKVALCDAAQFYIDG